MLIALLFGTIQIVLSTLTLTSAPDLQLLTLRIPYSLGNFGYNRYGASMNGTMYLPPSSVADDTELCSMTNIDSNHSYFSQSGDKWMILKRGGGCSFVKKALYAQSMDAKLIIIVNNEQGMVSNIIMSDDGQGYKMRVPTILIPQKEGERLIKLLQTDPTSPIGGFFEVDDLGKANKPIVKLGLNITSLNSFKLLQGFKQYYEGLKDTIELDVFYEYACLRCQDLEYTLDLVNDCYGSGTYCVKDPDDDGMATGADVLKEQLRQTCLWKYDQEVWWKYIYYFQAECIAAIAYDSCFKSYLTASQNDEVTKCVDESYITSYVKDITKAPNLILEEQVELRYSSGIAVYPGVTINNVAFRGNLDASRIFDAICEASEDTEECLRVKQEMEQLSEEGKLYLILMIVFIVFSAVLISILTFFLCRRYGKTPIHQEHNNALQVENIDQDEVLAQVYIEDKNEQQ